MTTDPGIEVLDEGYLEPRESALGPETERVFETGDAVLVRFRLDGGGTDWHTHGDREAYGVILEGNARLAYGSAGPNGDGNAGRPDRPDVVNIGSGEFFYVPPGVVHRDVNPSDDEQDYLLWLTGSEPRTVNVEGPPNRG